MFTGIVEEVGEVRRTGARLVVYSRKVVEDSLPGASVAVNGICLTVVERTLGDGGGGGGDLAFDLSPETLERSSLGALARGDPVNLERPVTLLTRLGGHLVQGHVDGVGRIASVTDDGAGRLVTIALPDGLGRYVVEKGSIAVDGVSLTVTGLDQDGFRVALVPFTLQATTLGKVKAGDAVNLEVDVVAKYVEGFLRRQT
jgi:riboflavin synthase